MACSLNLFILFIVLIELVYTEVLLQFDPGCIIPDSQWIADRLVLMMWSVYDNQIPMIIGSTSFKVSFVSTGQKFISMAVCQKPFFISCIISYCKRLGFTPVKI